MANNYQEYRLELLKKRGFRCQLTGVESDNPDAFDLYDFTEDECIIHLANQAEDHVLSNIGEALTIIGTGDNPIVISKRKHSIVPRHFMWTINLSNGLMVFEDNLNHIPTAILDNSWYRLQRYCRETEVVVTGFRFHAPNGNFNFRLQDDKKQLCVDGIYYAIHRAGDICTDVPEIARITGVVIGNTAHVAIFDKRGPNVTFEQRKVDRTDAFTFWFTGE